LNLRNAYAKAAARLDARPLKNLDQWLAPFRAYWDPRLDAMEN